MRVLERVERRLDFGEPRVAVDARLQRGRDVLRRAVDALDVLEQADRLGHRLGERDASTSRLDPVDLAADLAGDVPRDELVDLVDARERADRLIGEVDVRVDEELLRELDDRAVRAADVLARAALRSAGPETTLMMRSTW